MMKKIFEFGKAQESEPVLLLTWYFDISGYPLVKVKEFKAGIVADEYYNIFRFKKPGEK
jgi:hypothetical protein